MIISRLSAKDFEALSQVFDGIAFLFVTPEIINEQRREDISKFLRRNGKRIALFCGIIISILAVVLDNFFQYPLDIYMLQHGITFFPIRVAFSALIIIVPMCMASFVVVIIVVTMPDFVIRGRLFILGCGLFVLARIISISLALHGG